MPSLYDRFRLVSEFELAGDLLVRWARTDMDGDGGREHTSIYTVDWLRRHDYSNGVRRERALLTRPE